MGDRRLLKRGNHFRRNADRHRGGVAGAVVCIDFLHTFPLRGLCVCATLKSDIPLSRPVQAMRIRTKAAKELNEHERRIVAYR
ncbi:hypothetical protein LY10_02193 [Planktotalea frisia]|uniref:Uncharacterized protein n=1 Tax=Planktotalea frisia TaxID=696762 RepID=A0A1L9NWP1_9RHOB|nr:hypothetical protein PFRI_21560 [Planktotalea frisia]PZX28766.1 hypothetical protein LY10_02193 [Planktotalea frisia]